MIHSQSFVFDLFIVSKSVFVRILEFSHSDEKENSSSDEFPVDRHRFFDLEVRLDEALAPAVGQTGDDAHSKND